MVYDDAEKLYAEVAKDGKDMFEEAVGALAPDTVPLSALSSPTSSDQANLPGHPSNWRLVGLNTVHASRREVVEVPLVGPGAMKLRGEVVQIAKDGSRAFAIMETDDPHIDGAGLLSAKGMYADLQPVAG
jgi:alpha-mannosidase